MTSQTGTSELLSCFKLPEQDLGTLSFCGSNKPAKVKQWAEALPATRISYSASLLYRALPELSRIKTSAANRLQMLESMRPYVQQCIQGLSKNFLNQPLILPQDALKTATIAQALQKHMTVGYALVIREMCAKLKKPTPVQNQTLALAIHRAVTGLGLILLRSYQLYTPVPAQIWLETHSLYRLAEVLELTNIPVADPLLVFTRVSSIEKSYLRTLLMACTRPNQLTQNELSAVYSSLEDWVNLTSLKSTNEQNKDNLFIVNLCVDMPPMYKSRFKGSLKDDAREINTSRLLAALKKQKDPQNPGSDIIKISHEITLTLLDHLTGTWSVLRQRNFDRHITNNDLEVTIGIINVHYHITDGEIFNQFLSNAKKPYGHTYNSRSSFGIKSTGIQQPNNLQHQSASWSDSSNSQNEQNTHPVFEVHMLDTSPGGFCLDWRDEIPIQIKAGELLGLREPGRRKWSIGVVRWLRQNKGATQLGVQILAPMATPYGASMVLQSGANSEYMRVLMLPELKAINQPSSLLTAVVPFQEYCKVRLNQHGEEQTVQLTRRIFSTGSVSQFDFRHLETDSNKAEKNKPEDFASVWNNI